MHNVNSFNLFCTIYRYSSVSCIRLLKYSVSKKSRLSHLRFFSYNKIIIFCLLVKGTKKNTQNFGWNRSLYIIFWKVFINYLNLYPQNCTRTFKSIHIGSVCNALTTYLQRRSTARKIFPRGIGRSNESRTMTEIHSY